MLKDRPNKTPRPRTIARHYSEGQYCDYPTDIVLSAINSHDLDYNPTAIPIRLGFQQLFTANFNAFAYLSEHKSPEEIEAFLKDPDGFMTEAGIELKSPFDDVAPRIFAALVEDEMLELLKDPAEPSVHKLLIRDENKQWRMRHPERYPKEYMTLSPFWGLNGISYLLEEEVLESYGFSKQLISDIYAIIAFFSED